MDNREQQPLDDLLRHLQASEGEGFVYDRARIGEDLQRHVSLAANLPVRLLTMLGGFFASLLLLGFLLATGLYDSHAGMLAVGLLLLAGSVALLRFNRETLLETASVSCHIIGYLLFCVGFSGLFQSETALYGVLALLGLAVLFATTHAVLIFLAVLVFGGSLAAIVLDHQAYNLLHLYIGVVAALLTYISLHEASIIRMGEWFNRAYRPVRMGLVCTLVAALGLLVHPRLLTTGIGYYGVSGVLLLAAVLWVVANVMRQAGLAQRKQQLLVYGGCCLALVPTLLAPAVAGSLLILLTSFYIGHKTSFAVGLLALVYAVAMFYYDLQFTLLLKSGLLVLTGFLFLGGYLLLQHHLKSHAE